MGTLALNLSHQVSETCEKKEHTPDVKRLLLRDNWFKKRLQNCCEISAFLYFAIKTCKATSNNANSYVWAEKVQKFTTAVLICANSKGSYLDT